MTRFINNLQIYLKFISSDKVLILASIIVSILTIGNVFNKIFLGFEPLQYSFFSYDKILHFLTSFILVRIVFWASRVFKSDLEPKKTYYLSSLIALVLYGIMWETFEMFTFVIQENLNNQLLSELLDIPLDWVYDILGILTSHFLGYSIKIKS
ncbi:MAG: hypothetical protein ACTSR2_08345 [Candidatus Hodarchaeales archaeon]